MGEIAGEAPVLLEAIVNQKSHFPLGVFLTLGFCDSGINNKYGLAEVNKTLIDLLPASL